MKQKHFIIVSGERSSKNNPIFKDLITTDNKLDFDEYYQERLINFGRIETIIEIADIDTNIDFSGRKVAYYEDPPQPY